MSLVGLNAFVSQLASCSEKSACIARHIRSMHAHFKNMTQEKKLDENHQHLDADYKTLADVLIQEVIKRDLTKLYPSLTDRIFGEEDGSLKLKSSNEKITINVTGTKNDTLALLLKLFGDKSSQSIESLAELISDSSKKAPPDQCQQSFDRLPKDMFVDLSNIGIWIDPVDGTQQYISGTDGIVDDQTGIVRDGLPAALVLIGCFDLQTGQALIGVINRAFHQKMDEDQWKSSIYWGTALPNGKFNNLDDLHRSNDKRVLLHGSVDVDTFENVPNDWITMEVAGCGNKLLAIALKQANVYLVTRAAAYNWDLCAAHAIIRSIDGRILNLRQTIQYYEQNKAMNDLDLSQFETVYNNIPADKSFQPTDYACPPFIVYFNQADLTDILEFISDYKISVE